MPSTAEEVLADTHRPVAACLDGCKKRFDLASFMPHILRMEDARANRNIYRVPWLKCLVVAKNAMPQRPIIVSSAGNFCPDGVPARA